MPQFTHLHLHSQYSILDSTISISKLIKKGKEKGCQALAITDFGNLYGAIDFYKEAKAAQIKPIIGIEILLAPQSRFEKKKQYGQPVGYPIVLIAKNLKGYQNLCKLSSLGFIEGFYYVPRIDFDLLKSHADGLICLSGPCRSRISQLAFDGQLDELDQEIDRYIELFQDDFYLEVQRHQMSSERIEAVELKKEPWLMQEYEQLIGKQEKIIEEFKKISQKKGVKLVATHDVHYLEPQEWKAHQVLMNVQSGETLEIYETDSQGQRKGKTLNPKRETLASYDYYFKSEEEMRQLFSDLPEALDNIESLVDRVNIELDFKTRYYPVFIPPGFNPDGQTEEQRKREAEQFLRQLCYEQISSRYQAHQLSKVGEQYSGKDPEEVVRNRLEYELDIIISKGMCDYILIVYDFIYWAKQQKIPVGPGRGSGAGSIILYLIGITDIEPLRFNLFFERFINPERISYPDVDVDICMDRRQEVIDYTIRKYGADKVAQIITFGTMKAKMAIKDVGRVLNVPISKVNEIAKAVPDDLTITLSRALEIDPDFKNFYEQDADAKEIIELAIQVEGSVRNTGIHAAGIIISGEALMERIPVCTSKDSDMLVTQYSMKPVELVGMLKIDFLGLKTLTSIQKAVDFINQNQEEKLDWINLNLEDKKTFDLLNQGKTSGIFQLESAGMQELAKQLHIDKFEEIIAVGALYRPGPMEMIPSFINRKHGREEIENDHPLMQDILKETYGIIVYQEQVMQIASVLAGYSLGEGDVLRRAMGKKDKAEMARQGEKFKEGAQKKGIDPNKAMIIFEKVEKFASYGFNKSHAAAYGFLSYVTGYLKANYPKEWMAALMTCDLMDIAKVAKHIRECDALEIPILSPDVNESKGEFVATKEGIRFALSAIKGVGEGVVEEIVHQRETGYKSLTDFIRRIDAKKIGKKVIQNLIDAGCFDFTTQTRAHLHQVLEQSYERISKQQKERAQGILDLFSQDFIDEKDPEIEAIADFPKLEKLKKEKELLGFYLTGHPLDEFKERIKKHNLTQIETVPKGSIEAIKCALVIENVEIKLSKSNKKFAVLHLSDGDERYEMLLWSDLLSEYHHLIVDNQLVAAVLIVDKREEAIRLQCRLLIDLASQDEKEMKELESVFDRAVQLAQIELTKQKKGWMKSPSSLKEEPAKGQKYLQIKVVKNKIKLSHILEMKKIFLNYPGKQEIKILFSEEADASILLEIPSQNGVSLDKEVVDALKALSIVETVAILD